MTSVAGAPHRSMPTGRHRSPLREDARRRTDHLLTLGPFLLVAVLTFHYSPDDALITARYAANAVNGDGLVFNAGERAEGFSSPLHLALTILLAMLPDGLFLLKMKLMSLLFGGLTLLAAVKLVRGAELPRWAHTLALVAIGGSWNLAVSATNGLETSVVVFLTTLVTALLVDGGSVRRPVLTGVAGAALALARPESVLLLLLLALAVLPGGHGRARRLAWTAGPVAALVALTAARFAYFGELVPNTYFAKETHLLDGVLSGVRYFRKSQAAWDLLGRPGVDLSLLLLAGLLATAVVVIVRDQRLHLLPLTAVVVGQVVFVLKAGGDWMRGGRFLVPLVPSLTVLVTIGLVVWVSRLALAGRRVVAGGLVAATAAAFLLPVTSAYSPVWATSSFDDRSLIEAGNSDFDGASSRLWAMGPDLVSCLPPGASVAFTEMGYFGFANPDLTIVDTRGLTDPEIARGAEDQARSFYGIVDTRWYDGETTVGRVLAERRPEMILTIDTDPEPAPLGGEYRLVQTIVWGPPPLLPLTVYERADFACETSRGG